MKKTTSGKGKAKGGASRPEATKTATKAAKPAAKKAARPAARKAAKPAAKKAARPAARKAAKPAARKAAKPAARNTARPAARKAAKPAAKKVAAKPVKTGATARAAMAGPRADFGQPIDAFFARQPTALRPILDELRALVDEGAPDAESSIKWGMPFYSLGGAMMCALAGHKAHVNLILAGPPSAYADPGGLLEGEGKTGRHLKVKPGVPVPRDDVRRWIATAAELARARRT